MLNDAPSVVILNTFHFILDIPRPTTLLYAERGTSDRQSSLMLLVIRLILEFRRCLYVTRYNCHC